MIEEQRNSVETSSYLIRNKKIQTVFGNENFQCKKLDVNLHFLVAVRVNIDANVPTKSTMT